MEDDTIITNQDLLNVYQDPRLLTGLHKKTADFVSRLTGDRVTCNSCLNVFKNKKGLGIHLAKSQCGKLQENTNRAIQETQGTYEHVWERMEMTPITADILSPTHYPTPNAMIRNSPSPNEYTTPLPVVEHLLDNPQSMDADRLESTRKQIDRLENLKQSNDSRIADINLLQIQLDQSVKQTEEARNLHLERTEGVITNLKIEINNLVEELQKKNQEIEELRNDKTKLEEGIHMDIDQDIDTLVELRENKHRQQLKITELEEEIRHKETTIQNLCQDLKEANEKGKNYLNQLNMLIDTNDKNTMLSNQLLTISTKLRNSEQRVLNSNQLVDTLQNRIQDLKAQINTIQTEKETLLTQLDTTQQRLNEEILSNSNLQKELDKLRVPTKKEGKDLPYREADNIRQELSLTQNPNENGRRDQKKNPQGQQINNGQSLFIMNNNTPSNTTTSNSTTDEDEEHQILATNTAPDPFARYHLASLVNNIETLLAGEIYSPNIQGAQALNRWLKRIEVSTTDKNMRVLIAIAHLDEGLLTRLSGSVPSIEQLTWETLTNKLYSFLSPATYDSTLKDLYDKRYDGLEHPATFYSMICNYVKTMRSTFPNKNVPALEKVIKRCMLPGLNPSYYQLMIDNFEAAPSIDDFLSTFTRIYNEHPKHELFRNPAHESINMAAFPIPQNTTDAFYGGFTRPKYPANNPRYEDINMPQYPPNGPNAHQRGHTIQKYPHNGQWMGPNIPPSHIAQSRQTEFYNTQTNRVQTRPWDLWQDWRCTCGEKNFRGKGLCISCGKAAPSQPEDCWICACGRRVFIRTPKCPYCRREGNTQTSQQTQN